jgi:hypothetical protein
MDGASGTYEGQESCVQGFDVEICEKEAAWKTQA